MIVRILASFLPGCRTVVRIVCEGSGMKLLVGVVVKWRYREALSTECGHVLLHEILELWYPRYH